MPSPLRRATDRLNVPRWVIWMFGLGLLLRVIVMLLYSDVTLIYYGGDSTRYLRLPLTGFTSLFSDPYIPAGYAAFLKVVHAISRDIAVTIGVQHLLGIATAGFLFAGLRCAGAPDWACAFPAAVALFSGDHLFLESSLLTEPLWMSLLAIGIWALLDGRRHGRSRWLLVAAGVAFALSSLVRNVSLPFPAIAAVWLVWDQTGSLRARFASVALLLVPAVIVIVAYAATARIEQGYAGITDMSGFNLYGRTASFADCHRFTPPPGTRGLCQSTPPDRRDEGPYFYTFGPSPLYRAGFTAAPSSAPRLGTFARAAIIHQPWDYVDTVAKDLVRYVAPDAIAASLNSGSSPAGMSFYSAHPQNQAQSPRLLATEFSQVYTHVDRTLPSLTSRELLGSYQQIFRLNGFLVISLLVLGLLGIARSSGELRRSVVLLLLLAIYLYVAPVAVSSYDTRYGVPAGLLLSACAGLGAWTIAAPRRSSPVRSDRLGIGGVAA